jgi:hypothetical protein
LLDNFDLSTWRHARLLVSVPSQATGLLLRLLV